VTSNRAQTGVGAGPVVRRARRAFRWLYPFVAAAALAVATPLILLVALRCATWPMGRGR